MPRPTLTKDKEWRIDLEEQAWILDSVDGTAHRDPLSDEGGAGKPDRL